MFNAFNAYKMPAPERLTTFLIKNYTKLKRKKRISTEFVDFSGKKQERKNDEF